MRTNNKEYIYISNLTFDGSVFVTQVIDWLALYKENGVLFDLYVSYSVTNSFKFKYLKEQKNSIKKYYSNYKGPIFMFPSKYLFLYINVLLLFWKILFKIIRGKQVFLMSRSSIGKEVQLLKQLFGKRLVYFYDARAAMGEEKFFTMKSTNKISGKQFGLLGHIFSIEAKNVQLADKIFVVSNRLKSYLVDTFQVNPDKFVHYPCLSGSEKFYFSQNDRRLTREKLQYTDSDIVILYAGGLLAKWHNVDFILKFFNELSLISDRFKFLILSADSTHLGYLLNKYPSLTEKIQAYKVPNNEVVHYLNAADFGTLFRKDVVMNNVASPSKFAEYMLCGLPVLISQNVGDFSDFVIHKNLGQIVNENYDALSTATFLLNFHIDRELTANNLRTVFDKNTYVKDLIPYFTTKCYSKTS